MTTTHQAQSLLEPAPQRATSKTPWITVTGGKGGVGKTVIAVNLAISAARAGYRTLLADVDPGLANVDVHLRLVPRFTVEDLAQGKCSPAEAITEGPAGIGVLAGRNGSTALTDSDPALLKAVHNAIDRAARPYDLVICDTGAGIGPSVMQTIARSSLALAVTTPDPASVTDSYALIKLALRNGCAMPHLVVNRVRNRAHAMSTSTKLSSVTTKFLETALPLAGWLTHDDDVERSVHLQQPFSIQSTGQAADDLRALTANALSQLPARRTA